MSTEVDDMTRHLIFKTDWAFVLAVFALSLAVSITFGMNDTQAKPRPQDNGREYCILNDDGSSDEGVTYGRGNSCCYWESAGNGESLQVCLECDENWKNCKETLGSRANQAPRPNTSTGTATEAPSRKSPSNLNTPNIKLKKQ